jgi:hypothetical protein
VVYGYFSKRALSIRFSFFGGGIITLRVSVLLSRDQRSEKNLKWILSSHAGCSP